MATKKQHELKTINNEGNNSQQNFCENCLEETLPQSTGNLWSINFVGTTIKEIGGYCSACGSVVVEKRFILYGIPIHSYGFYRVKRILIPKFLIDDDSKFFARKLKNQKFVSK